MAMVTNTKTLFLSKEDLRSDLHANHWQEICEALDVWHDDGSLPDMIKIKVSSVKPVE